jgi:hypothetical protein
MKELDGLGFKVDWEKSSRMFLGNDNNTIKSSRFRVLMTKHLGNEGRIPRSQFVRYVNAKSAKWFTTFHDKYRNENI